MKEWCQRCGAGIDGSRFNPVVAVDITIPPLVRRYHLCERCAEMLSATVREFMHEDRLKKESET